MKRTILLLTLMAMVFATGGCQPAAQPVSEPPKTVNIAFFPNLTHAQALYGRNTNRFQDAFGDTKINWVEFNAGPSEIEAMFAGEVDIGYIGPTPAINGFQKSGGDVLMIANATTDGAILVTRKDLVLTDVSGLSGLRVAIPQFGNTQHFTLLHLMRANNLQSKDKGGTVDVVQAANADIKTLMDQGSVDAALVPEPWGARLINEIDANLLMDEKQVWGGYPVAVVIVRKTFMEQHPDLVAKFLSVHSEITEAIIVDQKAAAEVINAELLALTSKALEGNVLQQAMSRIKITTKIAPGTMAEIAEMMLAEGYANSGNIDGLIVLEGKE